MGRPGVSSGAIVYSAINVVAASAVYWHLINGGWLTNRYELSDPNIVNLALAIFEPLAVGCVIGFWIWRTPMFRRLLFFLALVQVLIGAGFLVFFAVFAMTWHPKMM